MATWKMAFAGSQKGGPRCPSDSSGVKQGVQHGWESSPRPKRDDFKAGNLQPKGEVSLWQVRWHLKRSLRGQYFVAFGKVKRPSRRLYRIHKKCAPDFGSSGKHLFFSEGEETGAEAYSPILNTSGKIGLASKNYAFLVIPVCAHFLEGDLTLVSNFLAGIRSGNGGSASQGDSVGKWR